MSTTALRNATTPITRIQTIQEPLQKGTYKQNYIKCDVVFGSPSLGCRGTGVCKITAYETKRSDGHRRDCKHATALLKADQDGKGVSLILYRAFLCTQIHRMHLRHGILELKEPCTIPAGFVRGLGLKTDRLMPGKYPIEELEGYFVIRFK